MPSQLANGLKNTTASFKSLLLFVLVFAGIGTYLLFSSFASIATIASLQAEQMSLPSGASVVNDSTASAGQAIKLTQNGYLSGQVSLPSAATSLSVSAKGAKCHGGWSRISLNVDGQSIIPWTRTSSTSWQTINSGPISLPAGSHKVSIGFNNADSCGRYLYVDVTNFYGTTTPPPIPTATISATPTTVIAGQAATLTWTSTNTTGCTASGAWSGSEPTSGTASTGAINSNANYTLTCTGSGGTATSTATVTVTGGSGGGGGSTQYVQRSGTALTLNGNPYKFVGINVYNANSIYGARWSNCGPTMGTTSSNPTGDLLDQNLTKLNSTGTAAQVMRSWFFESLAYDINGNIDWRTFDNTLAIAKKHNLRVIATLDSQWGPGGCVKSPYKDLTWYQSGYKSPDANSPSGGLSYRNYVQQIVTRYANDPTIMMWQFMNEAQAGTIGTTGGITCPSESASAAALRAWGDDIGGLIKGIDPNHLTSFGTGGLGGGCGLQGSDYKTVHASPYVDTCEYHDYYHANAPMPGPLVADLDFCGKQGLNKPLFVGETGMAPSVDIGPTGTYQNRADLISSKMQAQFNYSDGLGGTGVVGEATWGWSGHASSLGTTEFSTTTSIPPSNGIDFNGPLDPLVAVMVNQIKLGY